MKFANDCRREALALLKKAREAHEDKDHATDGVRSLSCSAGFEFDLMVDRAGPKKKKPQQGLGLQIIPRMMVMRN